MLILFTNKQSNGLDTQLASGELSGEGEARGICWGIFWGMFEEIVRVWLTHRQTQVDSF